MRYELTGYRDGKAIRFGKENTLEDARDTVLSWKLQRCFDRIDLDIIEGDPLKNGFTRENYTFGPSGTWHQRTVHVDATERGNK